MSIANTQCPGEGTNGRQEVSLHHQHLPSPGDLKMRLHKDRGSTMAGVGSMEPMGSVPSNDLQCSAILKPQFS